MVEFFDVGGAKLHRISRSLFYKQINGRNTGDRSPRILNWGQVLY
jgi:hypothetical protein